MHLGRFYTAKLGEYAGKYMFYKQVSHVFNISSYETDKVEEYSVQWLNKIGK